MIIAWKILCTIIVALIIPQAFNPKYRYNEHQVWEPELAEVFMMWGLYMFIILAIWVKY